MAVFGRFETVREISQTGLGSVWTAREAGAGGASLSASAMMRSTLGPGERFVVKLFQPLGYIPGDPRFDAEAEFFLRRARDQRKLVERGAKHWTKVHDAGRFEDGAYCVQDGHARSVQQLLVRKVDLWRSGVARDPGQTLRGIVSGILEALAELGKLAEGRGHGGLKPSNILLSGDGPVSESTVVLTDPMPDDPARRRDYGVRDKRDLGALIYQLVLHKPYREVGGWPVQPGPEWSAYGRRGGERWLELCNRLLDPRDATTPLQLDEVAQQLTDWPIERSRRVPMIAIGTAVVLLAVGGGTWLALRPPAKPVLVLVGGQIDQLKDDIGWIENVATIAKDDEIRQAAASDPGLGAILTHVNEYLANRSLSRTITYLRHERTKGEPEPTERAVVTGVSDLWQIYEPLAGALRDWPLPATLAESAGKAFTERGWPAAAKALNEAQRGYDDILVSRPSQKDAGPAAPGAGGADRKAPTDVRPADAIKEVLAVAAQRDQIEADWKQLDETTQRLTGTGDAVLALFPQAVQKKAQAAGSSDQSLPALIKELGELKKLANDADAARAEHYARADKEYFAEESSVYQDLHKVGEPDADQALKLVQDWRAQIALDKFVQIPIGDVWASRAVDDELTVAVKDMQQLDAKRQPGDEARLTPMSEKLKSAQEGLATIKKRLEAPRRKEYDDIRAQAKTVLATMDALGKEIADLKAIRLQEFEDYLPAFRQKRLASGSTVLDQEYARLRDSIDRGHAASKDISELRSRIMRVEAVLAGLNTIPRVEGLTGASAEVADAEREAALTEALPKLPRDAEGLPTEEALTSAEFASFWTKRTADYNTWLDAAKGALTEASALATFIADGYGPTDDGGAGQGTIADRWARLNQQPAFPKLLQKQESLRTIGQRLDRLRAINDSSDRAFLVQTIEARGAPLAEALAAWTKLRGLRSPVWPQNAAELRTAADLVRAGLAPLASTAETDKRRAQLTAWAADQARQTWAAVFEGLKPEAAEIDAGVELAAAFGITDADIAKLPPASRYNILLSRLRADLASTGAPPDDETVKTRLRRFEADAAALNLNDQGSTATRGALRDLVNAPPKKEVDLATVGPGSVGWAKADAEANGRWVVYTSPAGVNPPQRLRFAQVSSGEGGKLAAYLCTTEVSVSLFDALVEGAKASDDVTRLLAKLDVDPDPRKGPSAWSLVRKDARGPSKAPVEVRGADAKRVGKGWLNVVAGMDRGEEYYPAGLAVPPPEADSPMNYLPATVAVYTSRLAGCRLPTPAEWAAARAINQAGKANIRDKSWNDQHAFIVAQREAGKVNAPWPDEDIFIPDERKQEISTKRRRTAVAATTQDADQTLWFAPTSAEGFGDPFKHLLGNVAELLFEDSGRLDAMTPAAVLTNTDWAGLKVAGGSALSPAEIKPENPYAANSANAWYSDVGFRLAFSAGEGKPKPLVVRALDVVTAAPYLAGR